MKRSRVTVRWKDGLHLRPAAVLVKGAQQFHSTILLKVNEKLANARSILGLLLLCASMGTAVDLEINGEDEEAALNSITAIFESGDSDPQDSDRD